MNQNSSLDDRLEALGVALRARPRLTDRVMDKVRESATEDATERLPTRATIRRRRQLVTMVAGTVATISVALLIVITLFPSSSVGWAEVTKAIQSQKWIRGTATYSDGKRATMWLSPDRRIWAFRSDGSFQFFDGRERAKYEYRGRNKPITKLPLGENDAQRILPVDALSQDKGAIGPWLFGTEKIVQQERREVTEAGKTWIEFQMILWRGEMNQATLRVDPTTRLPVYLLLTSPKDKTKFCKWQFDYPTDGPTDIYALGVPREIKIKSRMPSSDAQQVLDAMASSRARIGDFRLIVGHPPASVIGSVACYPGSVVSRKGNRWRIDSCWPWGWTDLDHRAKPPAERNWGEWFDEQLKLNPPIPLYICDGTAVWENSTFQPGTEPKWQLSQHTAPQDLMLGEGLGLLSGAPYVKFASLLFPDLSPKPGWPFEFDPAPADAPGCFLLKRSARLATAEPLVGHEWYYVDPVKGHAVVRAELFNLPPDTPGDPKASQLRQTLRMENFKKSPRDFWYPTVVHDTRPTIPGNNRQGKGPIQRVKTTARYHFDFDADLPDSLFSIDDADMPTE